MTTLETAQTADFTLSGKAMPLDSLPLGSRCRILAIDETSESLLRLMEMGLIPGAVAVIEHSTPFRSPLSLRLQGCTLAIRGEDARRVMVTLLSANSDAEDLPQA